MPKLFSFRFDVDTHRCVREGMPALSELGQRLGAPFTFFVNMGRAVSVRLVLGGGRPTSGDPVAAKYPARRKLGWAGFLEAAILNPEVGLGSMDVIRAAQAAGHEVGLHGGLNHAEWQATAAAWDGLRFGREIDAVLPALTDALGGEPPVGFASPGWATSPALLPVLEVRGFRYLADAHGSVRSDIGAGEGRSVGGALPNVRTELTGEPGGVAYLEHLRASGLDDDAIAERFERDLERAGKTAVVYDHPYYAGLEELSMVERMVEIARGRGYEVVSLATVAGVRLS